MSAEHEFPATDLNSVLAAAAQDLRDHLRATFDLNAAICELMAADTGTEDQSASSRPSLRPISQAEDRVTSIIAIRAKIHDVRRDLDLVYALDRAREHDRHLERPRDPVRDIVHDDLRDRMLARARGIVCALDLADASEGIIDRADDLVRALSLDRDVNSALVRARVLARTFTIFDALGLAAGQHAEVFDRFHVLDQVRDLAHILNTARSIDSPLNWAVDLNRALDRVHEIDEDVIHVLQQAGDVVGSISLIQEWRRVLSRSYRLEWDLVRAYPRDLTGDLINDLINDIIQDLETVDVDASGLDLHHLDLQEVDVLAGVLWTVDTVWPISIAEEVRARSREISPGKFQVDGRWTERQVEDHSAPSH